MHLIYDFLKRHQILLGFLSSGILIGSGFFFAPLWPLGILGVTLFILSTKKAESFAQAALGGGIAFTLKALASLFLFWDAVPSTIINFPLGVSEPFIIAFYWLTTGFALGVSGSFLGAGLWLLIQKTSGKIWLSISPLLWLSADVIGSFTYALFVYGDGSTLDPVFSLGYIGYLLAEHPFLLQFAKFGGVYVLTIVVVSLAVALLCILENYVATKRGVLAIVCSTVLLLWFSSMIPLPSGTSLEDTYTVTLVDTTFGGSAYYELNDRERYRGEQLQEALRVALTSNTAYIILPENSRLTGPSSATEAAYQRFRFMYQDPNTVLIEVGRFLSEKGEHHVRAIVYDGIAKLGYSIDKQYLVPQGEYLPYFYGAVIRLLAPTPVIKKIERDLSYTPGPAQNQALLPEYVPGILFCFSQKDALSVRRLTREREMPFVVHPISHAWFTDSKVMNRQYDAMLRVHAVWNNVPIVSAGNMAQGFLYLPTGQKITPTVLQSGESWTVSQVAW